MDIATLQQGNSYSVSKYVSKTASKDMSGMTVQEFSRYQAEHKEDDAKMNQIRLVHQLTSLKNGRVDILVEGANGVAVVSGAKINLVELGTAIPELAIQLRDLDENKDMFLEEEELYTSWGERLGSAGLSIGGSTIGGAATGGTVTAITGPGTLAGAGVGAAVGFIGSFLWEGGKTVLYAIGDSYNSPKWVR